jgi:hypothetical protein
MILACVCGHQIDYKIAMEMTSYDKPYPWCPNCGFEFTREDITNVKKEKF